MINKGKSNNTIKTYIGVLESFNDWLKKSESSLKKLKSNHIQDYIDYLEEKQLSVGTIEKTFAVISVFTKFLEKPQLMVNVHRKVVLKAEEIPESLNPFEKINLLRQIELDGNHRNSVIVYTLLQTGIRVSELCALNCSDVDLSNEKGCLTVRKENGEIDRIIPISKDLRHQFNTYFTAEKGKTENDPLFLSSLKNRMTTRSVQYMLQKYHVHPHKLRHTFCQELINHGVDIRTVAKLAGHRDINVTKRYTKNFEADLETAINQTFT